MEILDGDLVSQMIFRRYAQNPNGWSYIVSPARSHGFYDAVVASAEESWQLKMDTIYKPAPLVLGSRSAVDLQRHAVAAPLSFGYREMNQRMVRRLEDEGERVPGLAELLASLAPVVPEVGKAYAHGPFVLTRGTLPIRDRAQATVDERLTSDMLKLVRNRYPGYS